MRSQRPPLPPAKSSSSAYAGNLRLLCSWGGRIVPQPRGKRFCYVGGENRFVVVERTISLDALFDRLAVECLAGRRRPFAVKYQLPGVDLDSLITLATDEDLENMISEYDRTLFPHCPCLRLFLFPTKNSPESTRPEDRVANASNGSDSLTPVNRLLGLDSPLPETNLESSSSASASTSPAIPLSSLPPITPPVNFKDLIANADPEIRRRQEDSSPNTGSSPPEKTAIRISSDHGEKVATFQVTSGLSRVSEPRINPYDRIQNTGKIQLPNCHNYPVYYASLGPVQTQVSISSTEHSSPVVQIPANLGMKTPMVLPAMKFPEASSVEDRQSGCSYVVQFVS